MRYRWERDDVAVGTDYAIHADNTGDADFVVRLTIASETPRARSRKKRSRPQKMNGTIPAATARSFCISEVIHSVSVTV